jgi:hypothetical protein
MGQDVYDMLIVAPFLIIAAFLMRKGSRFWENVWAGAMVYILYSYAIYGFAVHFNYLFLAYCVILGLSFFSLILFYNDRAKENAWFPAKHRPYEIAAMVFLSATAVMFAFLWLSDVVPALITGNTPKSVAENNFFTNPVHVLDLSFALPACIVSVILLGRKQQLGKTLAPVMLSLCAFMLCALGAMVMGMKAMGAANEITPAFMFAGIGITAAVILGLFCKE